MTRLVSSRPSFCFLAADGDVRWQSPAKFLMIFVASVVGLLAAGSQQAWATPNQNSCSAMSTANIRQIPQMIYTLTTGEVITYTTQHNFAIYDGGTEVFSSGSGTFSYTVNANGSNWGFAYSVAPTAISCSPAQTTFTVTTTADDTSGVAANCATGSSSDCTLRDALAAAAASTGTGLTVNFSPTIFLASNTQAQNTILTTSGALHIPSNTTIQGLTTGSGAGLKNLVAVTSTHALAGNAIFTVSNTATGVVIANLTIEGAKNNTGSNGAGISNAGSLTLTNDWITGNITNAAQGGGVGNTGTLVVTDCTFSDNSGDDGGGAIYSTGTLTVSNSTFYGNSTRGALGGAIAVAGGTATISHSTITGNNAEVAGGGINVGPGTLTLSGSIVAGNTFADGGLGDPDLYGSYTAGTEANIAPGTSGGTAPYTAAQLLLAPLGSYGGPTQTMPVLPTSPAFCTTHSSTAPGTTTYDQRGVAAPTNYGDGAVYCTDAGATNSNYSIAWTMQPATQYFVASPLSSYPTVQFEDDGLALPVSGTVNITDTAVDLVNCANGPFFPANVAFNKAGAATLPSNCLFGAPATADTLTAYYLTATGHSLYATTNPFNVVAGPTVTGISPSSGPTSGGTTITITGTNLSGTTGVKFGTVSATNVAVVSGTQITATIPAGTGTVDVTVTTSVATTPTTTADQYTYQNLQPLSVTAANITVYAGQTPTQYVSQLMASYSAPGLTGVQLEAEFANVEIGFTVSVNGGSYNIPLFSYGTYYGANLLQEVPAGAPTGTFTLTPYLIGPGAANFSFSATAGSLTISNLQPLSVTAANLMVYVGQPPTHTVADLMASYSAPGLTPLQLEAEFANAEIGFTVSVNGGSYNIPLFSYGTYYGANLLQEVPAGAPTGTFTLTPYLIGPGAAGFSFSETPGTLTIAPGTVSINIPIDY